jgi:hypothetical protein
LLFFKKIAFASGQTSPAPAAYQTSSSEVQIRWHECHSIPALLTTPRETQTKQKKKKNKKKPKQKRQKQHTRAGEARANPRKGKRLLLEERQVCETALASDKAQGIASEPAKKHTSKPRNNNMVRYNLRPLRLSFFSKKLLNHISTFSTTFVKERGMSSLKETLLGKEEQGIVPEMAEYCPKLTFQQRLWAFGITISKSLPPLGPSPIKWWFQ